MKPLCSAALAAIFLMIMSVGLAEAAIVKTDVEITHNYERVVFHSSQPLIKKKHFLLSHPERLVIDIARLKHGKGAGLSPNYPGNTVSAIRFGQFDATTSRLVIEFAWSVKELEVERVSEGTDGLYRLAVMLAPAHNIKTPAAKRMPTPAGSFGTVKPPTGFVPTPVKKPVMEAKEAAKPIIVIDAGHGGKDPGAVGRSGIKEKTVTFDYAKALRRALLKTGRYRVVLTREKDIFILLHDRVKLAQKAKGDVFISLHADSNPNKAAKGLSVYTVSEKASDKEAAALAARENQADILSGMDLSAHDKAVADILIDLAARESKNKAATLADMVIKHMPPKVPLLSNTHRFAGFRVLKAPDIPSILVEVGFLSSREDERRVQSREYRESVIQGIIAGLDNYFAVQ